MAMKKVKAIFLQAQDPIWSLLSSPCTIRCGVTFLRPLSVCLAFRLVCSGIVYDPGTTPRIFSCFFSVTDRSIASGSYRMSHVEVKVILLCHLHGLLPSLVLRSSVGESAGVFGGFSLKTVLFLFLPTFFLSSVPFALR